MLFLDQGQITDTLFSPSVFNNLEMEEGRSSKNPIVLDELKHKENSPQTTPLFEPPTRTPKLLGIHSFEKRIENVVESLHPPLFGKIYSVRMFHFTYNQLNCFILFNITIFFQTSQT